MSRYCASRTRPSLRVLLLVIATAVVVSAAPARAAQDGRQPAPDSRQEWLDLTHHQLSESLDASAVWFDRFFSDPRSDEESRANR